MKRKYLNVVIASLLLAVSITSVNTHAASNLSQNDKQSKSNYSAEYLAKDWDLKSFIEKIKNIFAIDGSIKVICVDENNEVLYSKEHKKKTIGTYICKARNIEGYELTSKSSLKITLTKENPKQEAIFTYKLIQTEPEKPSEPEIPIEPENPSEPETPTKPENPSGPETPIEPEKPSEPETPIEPEKPSEPETPTNPEEKPSEKTTYTIELDKFNIYNDNSHATETTKGINEAILYAKENGYSRVVLPAGNYAIDTSVTNSLPLSDGKDTWTHHRKGIVMQSDLELDMTGATLKMVPVEDPYYSIFTISGCKNAVVKGGTILGDREEHDYGMRINNEGGEFVSGDIDPTTGEYKTDETRVVTKDFIDSYVDWFTKEEKPIPNKFFVIPLWNTTMNTTDGGCAYVYCYDKDGNYIGRAEGKDGYVQERTLPEGTAKIKISLRSEKRLDSVIAITERKIYTTHEFGTGITVTASENIELNGVTVKNCIGDLVATTAPPLKVTVDNFRVINCTLENARRQGISYVATGENYLIKDSNIGDIDGVDPQCGIDIEHYDYARGFVIDNTNFYDNKKWDVINYNGTNVEIKNSHFTGAVAATYGHDMDIHDNLFEYKDRPEGDKVFKKNCITLGTSNNKLYNNTFDGGSVNNFGTGSYTKNNIFKNGYPTITSDGFNKYYNCEVGLRQSNSFPVLSGSYFEDCKVFNHNDSPAVKVTGCEFNNSSYNGRGPTIVENCKFVLKDRALLGGWKTEATNITFNNCKIESKLSFLESGLNVKLNFNNCDITTAREPITQYNTITFKDSSVTFSETGNESDFVWNISGYGSEKCPWIFERTKFTSQLPVTIYGNNAKDITTSGAVTIK